MIASVAQVQRIPVRSSFMGSPFSGETFSPVSDRKALGQWDILVSVGTGLLQSTPAVIAAYQAKRAADRAKQDKQRAEQEAAAAKAKAEEAAKVAADQKAKADALLKEQGLTPQGTPLATGKILGLDPVVAIAGGLGILGVGAALWFGLGK